MAREARHFVDEVFFVIFGKYLAEFHKKLLNFVRQPYYRHLGFLNERKKRVFLLTGALALLCSCVWRFFLYDRIPRFGCTAILSLRTTCFFYIGQCFNTFT